MVFAHGTKRKVFLPVPFGASVNARVEGMFEAGRFVAKAGNVGELELVVLVCEAWVSPARAQFNRPSEDPDRAEVLVFSGIDPRDNTQTFLMYICVRDKTGRVVELKPGTMPEEAKPEGSLLTGFLIAYRLFKS